MSYTYWLRTLLALWLCSTLGARAQMPGWTGFYGPQLATGADNYTVVRAVQTDVAGNVYTVGQLFGTAQFGSTTLTAASAAYPDLFVAKWSPATGNYVWAVQASSSRDTYGHQLVISGNSVYVVGYFLGNTSSFGSIALAGTAGASPSSHAYLAKLTDAGTTASWTWAQALTGALYSQAFGLAVNGSAVYLAGYYGGGAATFGSVALAIAATNDAFVARYTDAGRSATADWAVALAGSGEDLANALAAVPLAAGGATLYVGGTYGQNASSGAPTLGFGATTLTSAGGTDGFVGKLTDQGGAPVLGWARTLGGNALETLTSLDAQGTDVYVGGTFTTLTWQLGPAALTIAHGSDVYLAKLSDTGPAATVAWATQLGSPYYDGLNNLMVKGNRVYASGYFCFSTASVYWGAGTIAFGPTTLSTLGGSDVWVAELLDQQLSCGYGWARQLGGLGDQTNSYVAVAGSKVYATGGPPGNSVYYFTDQALPTRAGAGLPGLTLFPNPAHGTATLRVPVGAAVTVQVLDALGRVVRTASAPAGQDYQLSGLAPGVYAVRVQAGAASAVQRLAVE